MFVLDMTTAHTGVITLHTGTSIMSYNHRKEYTHLLDIQYG